MGIGFHDTPRDARRLAASAAVGIVFGSALLLGLSVPAGRVAVWLLPVLGAVTLTGLAFLRDPVRGGEAPALAIIWAASAAVAVLAIRRADELRAEDFSLALWGLVLVAPLALATTALIASARSDRHHDTGRRAVTVWLIGISALAPLLIVAVRVAFATR